MARIYCGLFKPNPPVDALGEIAVALNNADHIVAYAVRVIVAIQRQHLYGLREVQHRGRVDIKLDLWAITSAKVRALRHWKWG